MRVVLPTSILIAASLPACCEAPAPADSAGPELAPLANPWEPTDLDDIGDMARFTAPHAELSLWTQEITTVLGYMTTTEGGCPAVTEDPSTGTTVWQGDCTLIQDLGSFSGTLTHTTDGATYEELIGEQMQLVVEESGPAIQLNGRWKYSSGEVYELEAAATYSVVGGDSDDLSVRLDLHDVMDGDGLGGEGAGTVRVSYRQDGPTGDFHFSWTLSAPTPSCPEEEGFDLVMTGAREVRFQSGGDTPCDGEPTITVDGEVWSG